MILCRHQICYQMPSIWIFGLWEILSCHHRVAHCAIIYMDHLGACQLAWTYQYCNPLSRLQASGAWNTIHPWCVKHVLLTFGECQYKVRNYHHAAFSPSCLHLFMMTLTHLFVSIVRFVLSQNLDFPSTAYVENV